jgi:hypothetical protein
MTTDELVIAIEEFMTKYDPYGFYDTYDSFTPNEKSFDDIKRQVENQDKHMIAWFGDVATGSEDAQEREAADAIYTALLNLDEEEDITASTWKPYAGAYECPNCGYISDEKTDFCRRCEADLRACTSIKADTDIYGEDPEFFFTRDDIIDFIEVPLEDRIPEIKSCRGYIDKENGKYVLSVDIITDDYDLTGGGAPTAIIDMRKIKKPSDLTKYVDDIIAEYNHMVKAYDDVAEIPFEDDPDNYPFEEDSNRYYDPDPTQHGSLDYPITPWGGSVD